MKIEMGESLIYSWLRHIKQCQIAQLNWKISDKWAHQPIGDLEYIINEVQNRFDKPFGNFRTINQLIKSSEIDVIGFDFNNNKLFGVDVAFHSNGLNYRDNVANVTKKLLRTLLIFEIYFDSKFNKTVIFATPKINPSEQKKLDYRLEMLNDFIDEFGLETSIEMISNESFEDRILNPTLSLSNDVADTSELFLRSYQLTQLFGSKRKTKPTPTSIPDDDLDTEVKIGKLVQTSFSELFENNLLSDEEIKNLMDLEYSRAKFKMSSYPILTTTNLISDKDKKRYYKKVYGGSYLLCSQWIKTHTSHFKQWLDSIY